MINLYSHKGKLFFFITGEHTNTETEDDSSMTESDSVVDSKSEEEDVRDDAKSDKEVEDDKNNEKPVEILKSKSPTPISGRRTPSSNRSRRWEYPPMFGC